MELFLNSVPILSGLSREDRLALVDALEEVTFQANSKVGSSQLADIIQSTLHCLRVFVPLVHICMHIYIHAPAMGDFF